MMSLSRSPYKMQMNLIFYTHLICFAWIIPLHVVGVAFFVVQSLTSSHSNNPISMRISPSVCELCTFFSRAYLRMRVKMHTAVRWYHKFFRIWFEHLLNSKRLLSMWVSWKKCWRVCVRCTPVDGRLHFFQNSNWIYRNNISHNAASLNKMTVCICCTYSSASVIIHCPQTRRTTFESS